MTFSQFETNTETVNKAKVDMTYDGEKYMYKWTTTNFKKEQVWYTTCSSGITAFDDYGILVDKNDVCQLAINGKIKVSLILKVEEIVIVISVLCRS